MEITTQSELGPKGINIAYRLVERRKQLAPDVGAAIVARLERLEDKLQKEVVDGLRSDSRQVMETLYLMRADINRRIDQSKLEIIDSNLTSLATLEISLASSQAGLREEFLRELTVIREQQFEFKLSRLWERIKAKWQYYKTKLTQ